MTLRRSLGLRNAYIDAGYEPTLDLCVLEIYSGTQPSSAEDAETGTLLAVITDDGGTYTDTTGVNGLTFKAGDAGIMSKTAAQTWKGDGVADGTAGWFRIYQKAHAKGADPGDETYLRLDGRIGTTTGELRLHSLSIVTGVPLTIDTFDLTLPEASS